MVLSGDPQGHRCHVPRVLRAAAGRLPGRATGRGGLRQPDHPPLQAGPGLAGRPPPAGGVARGTRQPPRQPDRAHLGRAQGLAGQQPHLDDPGPRPPGARLLPRSQPHPAAGHRRTPQLTLAAQGLRTRLPGGRLAALDLGSRRFRLANPLASRPSRNPAGRTAFLAHKAELLTRIADQYTVSDPAYSEAGPTDGHRRFLQGPTGRAARCTLGNTSSALLRPTFRDVARKLELVETGLHALDGARHLRALGYERLAGLVAYHHSGSRREAELRGLLTELAEFEDEASDTAMALTYCDMTASATGAIVTSSERLADVEHRYGADHVVSQALRQARREIERCIRLVEARLREFESSQVRR